MGITLGPGLRPYHCPALFVQWLLIPDVHLSRLPNCCTEEPLLRGWCEVQAGGRESVSSRDDQSIRPGQGRDGRWQSRNIWGKIGI